MIASNMKYVQQKLKIVCCLAAVLYSFTSNAQSQPEVQQVNEFLNSKDDVGLNAIPSFYSKENTQGFQYFSRRWLRGSVVYTDNQKETVADTLKIDDSRFYNFDKFNNKLVSTQDGKSILPIPNEAISKFVLVDSGTAYVFKKISVISKSIYFQPMVESEHGYSVYKHTITKYKRADYQNLGYGETGKKYDEYVDSYEYYLVFPGGKDFKKVSLNTASLRKALKDNAATVDEFFQQNHAEFNEDTLYDLVLFLNNKAGY